MNISYFRLTRPAMVFIFFICFFVSFGRICLFAQKTDKTKSLPNRNSAQKLIGAALAAMGGETRLRELKSLQFEGIGHTFFIEQSERPEGPWIVGYRQTHEIRDLINQRVRTTTENKFIQIPEWTASTLIVADGVAVSERGGKFAPAGILQVEAAQKELALAPEKILINALESADLRVEKDIIMQSVAQHVVKFTWRRTPVTIYLNTYTNLPTAVETLNSSPYDHMWTVWGDYRIRTFYTFWTLEENGLVYPHQFDVERNDTPFSSLTILKMQVNAPLPADAFNIPAEARQRFAALPPPVKIDDLPLGRPDRPVQEIAPGVFKLAGRWDTAFVKQNDGVVIIEAPISSGYSVKVLDEAKRRFPGLKVKAVITTSDAFPHWGGVREYAARGIPIYALDLNRPILEKALASPHTFDPDALQNKPRRADFKFVGKKTILGEGANRLELYPVHTETGERMMMVYFPEYKLLYASDLIQKMPSGGFFMPEYVSEVIQAAGRENLAVHNVFAMHSEITPWTELTKAVAIK